MSKLPRYTRKGLFFLAFSVVSATLYILVSVVLFDYLASQTRFNKIKDAIEKSERFASVDQDINIERALNINLHLSHVGIFDKYCNSVFVNDLSLNFQSCVRKSDLYFWYNHKTGQSDYIIGFSKEGELKEFFKDNIFLIVVSCIVYILLNSLLIIFIFFIFVVTPASALSVQVDDILNNGIEHLTGKSERNPFLSDLYKSVTNLVYDYSEFKKKEAVLDISLQIAHDIRSPIELLKGVNLDRSNIDEEQKERFGLGLNRIQEISNNLLNVKRGIPSIEEEKNESLLFALYSIVHEKKIEYEKYKVAISISFHPEVSGISIGMPVADLKRIISNLINNSVESFQKEGIVQVGLSLNNQMVVIEIKDNGPGIPYKIQETIFMKGLTTKKSGNGLGLYMAKQNIEKFEGNISYLRENDFTHFRITFPVSSRNLRIKTEINFSLYSEMFYVGRDIHYYSLIKKMSAYSEKILNRLESLSELEVEGKLGDNSLIFIDGHDFSNKILEIEKCRKLVSRNRVILFVDHLEFQECEKVVRNNELELDVVPNIFIDDFIVYKEREIILIDDDKFMRIRWNNFFQMKGIKISCYESVDAFLARTSLHSLEARIFVDSILSNNIRGEIESEKIYLKGFKNIFLATSFKEGEINCPYWVRGIFSKDPKVVF